MCIHISQSHPTKNKFYTTTSPLFCPVYHYRWSGNQRQAKDGWENFLGAFESFEALLQIVLVSVHRFITYTYMRVRVCVIVCVRVFLCVCVREGVGERTVEICVRVFMSQKYFISVPEISHLWACSEHLRASYKWYSYPNSGKITCVLQCGTVRCSALQRIAAKLLISA